MEQATDQSAPQPGKLTFDPKDVEANKGITVLSYIGVLCLVPLLANKDSKFAQAHAKQGLALFLLAIASGVVSAVPIIGWIVGSLAMVLVFVLAIIGIIKVLQGEFWAMPVLYDLSKKLNF